MRRAAQQRQKNNRKSPQRIFRKNTDDPKASVSHILFVHKRNQTTKEQGGNDPEENPFGISRKFVIEKDKNQCGQQRKAQNQMASVMNSTKHSKLH